MNTEVMFSDEFGRPRNYPVERSLDGCYFRVQRGDKFVNRCFTDLTDDEQEQMMKDRPAEWYKTLMLHLARRLRRVGDELDLEFITKE